MSIVVNYRKSLPNFSGSPNQRYVRGNSLYELTKIRFSRLVARVAS